MKTTKKSKARRRKRSKSPDPPHCFITTLPNELLSLIIQNCDTATLLLAASVCKQLNVIAISHYLTQIGFVPHDIVLGDQPRDIPFSALRGLRLAFSVKSVDSIACYLPPKCTTELREVQRWLDCLFRVGGFYLHFNQSCIQTSAPLKSASIADVLCALYGKQCYAFWVTGDAQTDFKRIKGSAMMPSTLATATIRAAAFFSHPFVDWTVSSLNGSSRLRSLNLQNLTELNCVFLTRLRLRALRELDITTSIILHSHLSSFLSKHPRLEMLSLVGVQLKPAQPEALSCTMPNVHTLTCDSGDLAQLLFSMGSLPKLTSISFLKEFSRSTVVDAARCLGTLFHVISLRPQIKRLLLELTGAEAVTPWLQVGNRPRRCHRYQDKFPLDKIVHLTVICSERSIVNQLPPWLILFPQLKKLTVQQFSFPWEDEEMVDFVRSAKEICADLSVVSLSLTTKYVDEWLS